MNLRERLAALRMTPSELAARARVPQAEVYRLLTDPYLGKVLAAVGAGMEAIPFRRVEAERKARWLVNLVLGEMALEGQGVGEADSVRMFQKTLRRLLDNPEELWG